MKKIVVLYIGNDWDKDIPIFNDATRKAFEDWHTRALKKKVEIFRASLDWYNQEKNIFTKSWAYRNNAWVKVETSIVPDLIFDKIPGKYEHALFEKKMAITQKVKVYNHPLFRSAFNSKFNQYLILKDFMAPSFLATNAKELQESMDKISSSKVVIKPLYGSGGFGIIINEKEKIEINSVILPVIVQEFIESNNGIPGFSQDQEIADLRMIFMNHKLMYALSRIAKQGSYFTNFHQGAEVISVPVQLIPKIAKRKTRKIVKLLSIFSEANYSLDFMFDNSGNPFLVEINTTPGFDLLNIVGDEKIKEKYYREIYKLMK